MYVFFNWDDNDPTADLDIRGKQYERIIEICFQYCSYFTLNEARPGTLFDLPEKELDQWPAHQYPPAGKKHLFFCTDRAKAYLVHKVCSLFSWITWGTDDKQDGMPGLLPEDLCFYRRDGSVFLWSETHEGICALCPKPEEDVSDIVSQDGWHEAFAGDVWGVPARLEDYEYNLFGNRR